MKVLYISYDGLTDALGQSQILPYLIHLSKFNYEIHIISLEKQDKFYRCKNSIEKKLQSTSILWHPLIYQKKIPLISQYINVLKLKKKAFELAQKNIFHIVHCRSYLPMFVGLKLKKKYLAKLIFDIRGFWVDERIEGQIWSLNNPFYFLLYKYFKYKEKKFFQHADYIVSLTHKAKKYIQKNYTNISPIEVIPCCYDPDLFNIDNIDEQRKLEILNVLLLTKNDFIIGYLGSLGTWYLTDKMMELFNLIINKIPNAKFLFISNDNGLELHKYITQFNIPKKNVIIVSANREEVPEYLSILNLSVFFIKPSFSKIASSPTKFGELLAMGIPVITNKGIGDLDEQVETNNLGALVKDFNKEEFDKIIQNIEQIKRIESQNLIKFAELNYSLKNGVELYKNIYIKLCPNS